MDRKIKTSLIMLTMISTTLVGCGGGGGGGSNSTPPAPPPPPPQNSAPVLNQQPLANAQVDVAYQYQLDVSDADGDTIIFSTVAMPTWLTLSDTGLLAGIPRDEDAGEASVELTYSDGTVSLTLAFSIMVEAAIVEPPPEEGPIMEPPVIPPARTKVNAEDPSTYNIIAYGAGSISDGINPDGYGCAIDYGTWIYGAGVVEPGVNSCNPIGDPTYKHPQVVGERANSPIPTHKWWGSIPFMGEMKIGDPSNAAYITPDPIASRISNKGARLIGMPSGLRGNENNIIYSVPDPFNEVFEGIAVANSEYTNLEAYLRDYSDASVTVQWQDGNKVVMDATFVHGSPYVYFNAYRGKLVLKTLRQDSGEKGTFYQSGNHLGVWTDVAGLRNNFLISGEGTTTFENISSNSITVTNTANAITVALLPNDNTSTIEYFADMARNVVSKVDIDYQVNRQTNEVTISHRYYDDNGNLIETLAGMHPLHWKNSAEPTSGYKVRSARGVVKFAKTSQFSYQLPYVGILPYLPSSIGKFDQAYLESLVTEYFDKGPENWNLNQQGELNTDTYWSGKSYGKMAEIAAIARSIGMETEANVFTDWLKNELADWFTADTNGSLDTSKYFVYDEEWTTLLGMQESFGSHQSLNDHHFHYGYFVRAAAEVCRVDPDWCSSEQYGPMIELLIRDYASSKEDDMFPYLRNFDPANGFSWASGNANFVLGNNNESTSEAANAYGAIVLYGMITNDQELVERGMYLHASSTSAYWEYWNNIDRFRNESVDYPDRGEDYDNFPSSYQRLTTSIIWGQGSSFSTWFSGAFAHILGIQGLPSNPMILHVGQYSDYMKKYVELGLAQSSNGKPSGLGNDEWRDIWWNLWSMTDAAAAIEDYETLGSGYHPENGETKAHTYHWMQTWNELGHVATGTGELTADHPVAVAFDNQDVRTYLVYNYDQVPTQVSFSDGKVMTAAPAQFSVSTRYLGGQNDSEAPTAPTSLLSSNIAQTSFDFSWTAASDNNTFVSYQLQLLNGATTIESMETRRTNARFAGLDSATNYTVKVRAMDSSGNMSSWSELAITTADETSDLVPRLTGEVYATNITPITADLSWLAAQDDGEIVRYDITISNPQGYLVTDSSQAPQYQVQDLSKATAYEVSISAVDDSNQVSSAITGAFSTGTNPYEPGSCELICVIEDTVSSIFVTVQESATVIIHYTTNGENPLNITMDSDGSVNTYTINNLSKGDVLTLSFTVIPANGQAYDTEQETFVFTASTGG